MKTNLSSLSSSSGVGGSIPVDPFFCEVKGSLRHVLCDNLGGSHIIGVFKGRRLVGVASYSVATPNQPAFEVAGVLVKRNARKKYARSLLRALSSVIRQNKAVVGNGFFIVCDSQSTAGERMAKLAEKRFGCPVVDLGRVARIATGESVKDTDSWEELL